MRLRPSHRFALKADPYSGTAQHGTAKHSCTNLESDIHTSTYFNCMVFWEQNTSSDAHVLPATHLIKCTFTAWISWLHCQSFAPTISIGKAVQKTSEDHKKTSVLHCSLGPRPSAMCSNDQKACEAQCLKRPFYLQALLWKISRRTATVHPLFGLLGLWVINVAAFHLKFDLYCNHLRTFNQMNIWQSDGNIRFYQVPILDLSRFANAVLMTECNVSSQQGDNMNRFGQALNLFLKLLGRHINSDLISSHLISSLSSTPVETSCCLSNTAPHSVWTLGRDRITLKTSKTLWCHWGPLCSVNMGEHIFWKANVNWNNRSERLSRMLSVPLSGFFKPLRISQFPQLLHLSEPEFSSLLRLTKPKVPAQAGNLREKTLWDKRNLHPTMVELVKHG